MKWSILSDIHIGKSLDHRTSLLENFFTHPEVMSSDGVILLGDIFHRLVGNHSIQKEVYFEAFSLFKKYLEKGKKLVYCEGNHDFNLNGMFDDLSPYDFTLVVDEFRWVDSRGRLFTFCHGDKIFITGILYQYYWRFTKSSLGKWISDYLLSPRFLHFLENVAVYLFSDSSHYLYRRKDRVHKILELRFKGEQFTLVTGHTHFVDDIFLGDFRYLNPGAAFSDRKFLVIEEGNCIFIDF